MTVLTLLAKPTFQKVLELLYKLTLEFSASLGCSDFGLFDASDRWLDLRIGFEGGVFFFGSEATVESVVSSIGGFSRGGGGGDSTISCFLGACL